MKNEEKIDELKGELKKYADRLRHMSAEYAQTKEGSAYGVEYYEIQCRVYQAFIENIEKEIERLKKGKN
jgi:flagellar biosynthesis chaperone FliJ